MDFYDKSDRKRDRTILGKYIFTLQENDILYIPYSYFYHVKNLN